MTHKQSLSRRLILQAGAATAALGAPGLLLAQPKPVKVGLLHPVSGALAYSGGQSRLGGMMAIDEINAAGGIKSMGGAKLEAMLGDEFGGNGGFVAFHRIFLKECGRHFIRDSRVRGVHPRFISRM